MALRTRGTSLRMKNSWKRMHFFHRFLLHEIPASLQPNFPHQHDVLRHRDEVVQLYTVTHVVEPLEGSSHEMSATKFKKVDMTTPEWDSVTFEISLRIRVSLNENEIHASS